MITLPSTSFLEVKNSVGRDLPQANHSFLLMFIRGPKRLLTSRISMKCAAVMVLMCLPSLLFCGILTIPAMIFQSPYQNAYYQFSQVLEQDPSRWAVLILTAICSIMSLAIPATMTGPVNTDLD